MWSSCADNSNAVIGGVGFSMTIDIGKEQTEIPIHPTFAFKNNPSASKLYQLSNLTSKTDNKRMLCSLINPMFFCLQFLRCDNVRSEKYGNMLQAYLINDVDWKQYILCNT